MATSFETSGRDDSGIGGGPTAFEREGLDTCLLAPFVVLWSSGLFIQSERAGLAGLGGGRSSEIFCMCLAGWGFVGLLGGSAGIVGGGVISTVETLGEDFGATSDALFLSASLYPGKALDFSISLYRSSTASFVLLGGRGGKVAGSNTGALTLPMSSDGVLSPGALLGPFDKVETVEMVDEMDSFEVLLSSCCSEGLRGGKAGEGCADLFLAGSFGGGTGARFEGCSTF